MDRLHKSLGFILCVLPLGLSISPALADWQYTKWGMTPEQVIAASNGAVTQGGALQGETATGYETAATGTYVSGNYHFRATFLFQQNALAWVNLSDKGYNECMALKLDVEGLYGPEYHLSHNSSVHEAVWHDEKSNNLVTFTVNGFQHPDLNNTSCWLEYQPLTTKGAKGL